VTRHVNVANKVRLGLFTYDTQLDCLLDPAGKNVSLRPQSAQILSLLVDHLGQTVTKEHLISTVWQNVSVTDDSLTQCIADIRRALGDSDRSILKTRPKVGYLLASTSTGVEPAYDAVARGHDTALASRSALVCIKGAGREAPLDVASFEQGAKAEGSGRLIQARGGSAVFAFTDVSAALRFALGLSASPGGRSCCIGVDLVPAGQVDVTDTSDLRVAGLAASGQPAEIIASVEIRDQFYGELDFDFEDLGEQTLSPGADSVRAYRVSRHNGALRVLPNLAAEDLLPTIAVVPLRARIASADTTVIGEIFADELIATMSRSADINVISRLSTTVFRAQNASLSRMGDVLGADFVMTGTILTHDTQVGLMLELAEVTNSKVLWAERVEIDVAALLNGFEAVAEIISKIRKAIALHEIARARSTPISSLRNYTLLISAVGLMHRLSPVDFQMAGDMLRALIERNPNQPASLSWMARWHVLRVQQGWSEDPQKEAQLALGCSTKALDIDPENALALTSEGFVLTNLLHKLDEAEDRYDAALDANPNDANGRLLRGTLFAFQGKGDAAKRDTELALHLAPIDPHRFFFLALAASANIAAEDYARAMMLVKASLRMNRTHTSTLRVKAVAQMRLGEEEAARETTQELLRLQPNMTVSAWLKNSPSASFDVGRDFAETLRETGVPE
jgi:DNA-binding winged helix-turn-helix (wHTH) protein/TolB-like protein/Tfp pilus assembly protein PilF